MEETETTENAETTEVNALSMSDEEFMASGGAEFTVSEESTETDITDTDEDTANAEENEYTETSDNSNEEEETSDTEEEEKSTTDADNVDTDTSEDAEDTDNDVSDQDTTEQDTSDESDDTETDTDDAEDSDDTEIDYKTEYEKLFAPFKANGMQITVKSTDEIITLMQMGANYTKKMSGLKPSLKIVKLLEKNNLLDSTKLNYLIDLNNKKPEAITQLLKESKIDPMDIDVSTESEYKPEERTVTDNELELDSVLESIKDTPTYNQTLTILTDQWDEASRGEIIKNPHIIDVINTHIADGTYDAVNQVVQHERNLGKLNGMTDIAAYKLIGDYLQSKNELPHQKAKTENTTTKPKVVKSSKKVTKQKKAVSSTKHVKTASKPKNDFNPLAMSDEDFQKIANKEYG